MAEIASPVLAVSSLEQWAGVKSKGTATVFVWASFHAPCMPGALLHTAMDTLASRHPAITFASVDAENEDLDDIVEELEVEVIPTFAFFQDGVLKRRLEGVNVPELNTIVEGLAATAAEAAPADAVKSPTDDKVKELLACRRMILFISGSPAAPADEESKALLALLSDAGLTSYTTYDVQADEAMSAALQAHAGGHAFPFVYVDGELVGGAEEVSARLAAGGNDALLPPREDPADALAKRLRSLIDSASVMLFMKGTPEEPRCGFSRTMVGLLKDAGVVYDSFDILEDSEVRAGLKDYSQWRTFPQLYVYGKLIGGLDVLKDMVADVEDEGPVVDQLGIGNDAIDARIDSVIARDRIMLFMKGTPEEPRCGFSRKMVAIMAATEVSYSTYDILRDRLLRNRIKDYKEWRTFPQLYVDGKLLGGLDIVRELAEDEELDAALAPK
eukprot:PLAT12427.1.p1 GENE.PLAT12427.1~~PLAT12427.1.p1  ORF type:complete len:509 (-),score=163.42 PLAT12427.1:1402-2730(-)